MFTITLPEYSYTHTYDQRQFMERFPGSMITSALQSQESEIPISNPAVTPAVLSILDHILKDETYPYVSIELRKALDYLCIDIPEVVSDPRYKVALEKYPKDFEQDSLKFKNHPDHYGLFLRILNTHPEDLVTALFLLDHFDINWWVEEDEEESPYGTTYRALELIYGNRYVEILEAFAGKYPSTVNSYGMIYSISEYLQKDMYNYQDYIRMFLILKPYFDVHHDWLEVILSAYNGSLEVFKRNWKERAWGSAEDNKISSFIALMEGHYDTAQFIIESSFKDGLTMGWFNSLFDLYVKSPKSITPQGIQILVEFVPESDRAKYLNKIN